MQLGQYRIDGKLAEGGMGMVYRATHVLLNRPAAIKVLLPEMSADRTIVERFFNEARAATAIRHPGIVEIYDFGYSNEGLAYLVMELLDGEPLASLMARTRRLDETSALRYTRGIASALAAAHGKGIVHRDLKPDNVFLVPDADLPGGVRVKLLDFGIAKITEAGIAPSSKTRTQSVLGTPTYMSPEQCRGAGFVDHRSDLYSLGCILYEMLVGHPPFAADGLGEVLAMHQMVPPTPPRQLVPTISERAEKLIMALLVKSADARIQSANDLLRILGTDSTPAVSVTLPSIAGHAQPTIARTPTTLGSSSGQQVAVAPRRAGRALVIGGVAAAVGAFGITLAVSMLRPKDSADSSVSPASGTTPAAAVVPSPPVAAPPPPVAVTPPLPSAPAHVPAADPVSDVVTPPTPDPAAAPTAGSATPRPTTSTSATSTTQAGKRPSTTAKKPPTTKPPHTNAHPTSTTSQQAAPPVPVDRGD